MTTYCNCYYYGGPGVADQVLCVPASRLSHTCCCNEPCFCSGGVSTAIPGLCCFMLPVAMATVWELLAMSASTHLSDILMDSLWANALHRDVFPVPGGPCSSTTLQQTAHANHRLT